MATIAETLKAREKAFCHACKGSGTVLDIYGEGRPCSRCQGKLFDQWVKRKLAASKAAETAQKKEKR